MNRSRGIQTHGVVRELSGTHCGGDLGSMLLIYIRNMQLFLFIDKDSVGLTEVHVSHTVSRSHVASKARESADTLKRKSNSHWKRGSKVGENNFHLN